MGSKNISDTKTEALVKLSDDARYEYGLVEFEYR